MGDTQPPILAVLPLEYPLCVAFSLAHLVRRSLKRLFLQFRPLNIHFKYQILLKNRRSQIGHLLPEVAHGRPGRFRVYSRQWLLTKHAARATTKCKILRRKVERIALRITGSKLADTQSAQQTNVILMKLKERNGQPNAVFEGDKLSVPPSVSVADAQSAKQTNTLLTKQRNGQSNAILQGAKLSATHSVSPF